MISTVDSTIEVVAQLQSIDESVEWFSTHPDPDIVFMDIHLADGSSFAIFETVEIHCPVIFTTAYDEYALKAFEVNSIGYLLKPIDKNKLSKAILKYRNLAPDWNHDRLSSFLQSMKAKTATYKTHYLIPRKDKLIPLGVERIFFIHTENKLVKVYLEDNSSYTVDYTLEEMMADLNPSEFFRANRQFIVAHKAIRDISLWFNQKLCVNLLISTPENILISKARASEFKSWYMRER